MFNWELLRYVNMRFLEVHCDLLKRQYDEVMTFRCRLGADDPLSRSGIAGASPATGGYPEAAHTILISFSFLLL